MFKVRIPAFATFWREDEIGRFNSFKMRKSDGRVYLRRLGVVNWQLSPRSLSLSPPSILITWPSMVPPQQPSILPGPVREAGLHDAGLFQRSALHLGQDGLQVKIPMAIALGFLRCFLRGMHLFKVPEQNLIGSHLVLICQSQDDLRIHWFISIGESWASGVFLPLFYCGAQENNWCSFCWWGTWDPNALSEDCGGQLEVILANWCVCKWGMPLVSGSFKKNHDDKPSDLAILYSHNMWVWVPFLHLIYNLNAW